MRWKTLAPLTVALTVFSVWMCRSFWKLGVDVAHVHFEETRKQENGGISETLLTSWDKETLEGLKPSEYKRSPTVKINTSTNKLILWYHRPNYVPPADDKSRPLKNCPDLPCKETSDRKLLQEADAVIFDVHSRNFKSKPKRFKNQVWVFYAQEAPPSVMWNIFKDHSWRDQFNWTCTYRSDSDIYMPYGILVKNPNPPQKDYSKIVAAKTKMAAWVVSHCSTNSLREKFAQEMAKHGISVDIYGACGKKSCFSRDKVDQCYTTATRNYSFYLAFENTLCRDYITEKFFGFFERDVILIARSGLNLTRSLPEGTYINTDDFQSISQLVSHLKYLHNNKAAYTDMLKKKDQYKSVTEIFTYAFQPKVYFTHTHYLNEPMCDMCRKLLDIKSNRKTYPDIYSWYNQGTCRSPDDLH